MKVIGVTGQLMAGKDVFCDYLAEELNKQEIKWKRTAFANAVKDTFCNAFGVDRDFIEKYKRLPDVPDGFLMPIRQCLQFIGDGFRKIRNDIWIEIALRDNGENIIISDGRYFNEANAIRQKNGLMFLMYRPGYINDDPNPSESQVKPLLIWAKNHLKDGAIDHKQLIHKHGVNVPCELQYYNYFLINDGSVDELKQKIKEQVVPYILGSNFYNDRF